MTEPDDSASKQHPESGTFRYAVHRAKEVSYGLENQLRNRLEDDTHAQEDGSRRSSSSRYSMRHAETSEHNEGRQERLRSRTERGRDSTHSRSVEKKEENSSSSRHRDLRREPHGYEDRHHHAHNHHQASNRESHTSRDRLESTDIRDSKRSTKRDEDGYRSGSRRFEMDVEQSYRLEGKERTSNHRSEREHRGMLVKQSPTFHKEQAQQPAIDGSYPTADKTDNDSNRISMEVVPSRPHSHREHRGRSESRRGRLSSGDVSSASTDDGDTSSFRVDDTPGHGASSRHLSARTYRKRSRSRSRSHSSSPSRSRERSLRKRSSSHHYNDKDRKDKRKRKHRDRSESRDARKRRRRKEKERDREESGRKEEERRSVLTGKKIKLKIKQDKDDIEREKNRMDLLQFLNSTLG